MSASTWAWIGGTIDLNSPTDWSLAAGSGNTDDIPEAGDTAINTGTLAGYGLIAASLINGGTVTPMSTLEIEGSVTGSGSMIIEPGGTVQIDGTLDQAQTIVFSPGAPETLILGSPTGTIANPIIGFTAGDRIEFTNDVTITAASLMSGNTLEVTFLSSGGTVGTYDLTGITFAAGAPLTLGYANVDPATGDAFVATANFIGWTGATDTDFGTGTNWNFGGVAPGALDVAYFNNGIGGTISGAGSVEALYFTDPNTWSLAPGTSLSATSFVGIGAGLTIVGQPNGTAGALTIGSDSTITTTGGFISVSQSAGDSATLTIADGGVLEETAGGLPTLFAMYVGSDLVTGTSGANGAVVVSGTGSLIDLAFNGLDIGDGGGNGTVTVAQGGSVLAATLNSAENPALAIGRLGTGTLDVTDPGSQFSAAGSVSIANAGTGTLTVENFATFLATADTLDLAGLTIGDGNTIGVGGTGAVTVTTNGVLDSHGELDVGSTGDTGQLSVLNAGTVLVGTTLQVGVGGTIAGGTAETTNGTLAIGAGGTVELTGTAQTAADGVYLGDSNTTGPVTTNATATVTGAGALLDTGGNGLAVGQYGVARLTVSLGGTVVSGSADSSQIAALALGRQGSGSVTVTGAGSQLSADGVATVGQAGSGSLSVSSGGRVVIGLDSLGVGGLFIGGYPGDLARSGTLYSGSSGTAIISTGGNLFSQGNIQVGGNGDSGLLIVASGTVATSGQLLLGGSIAVAPGNMLVTSTGTTAVTAVTVESGNGELIVSLGTVQVQGLTEAAGSTISLLSGTLLDAGSGNAAGLITGSGTITGSLTNTGSVVANRGTLEVAGGILGAGTITINSASAFRSDAQLGNSQSVTFATASSAEALILGAPQATNGFAITNWQTGDEIVFNDGSTVSGANWLGNGTLEVDTSGGTMDFTDVSLAAAPIFATGSNFVELIPCFVVGTHIATPRGEKPVERLSVGDLVLTVSGRARPILWIGKGRALATRGQRSAATPVIVRKGALGENVPHRDLHVTKGHSIYIDGVLIPAEFLVNHRSIVWDDRAQEVEVYHIELQTHDVLFADGAPAETYRDDGNRWLFQNANTGWELPPPPPCAPVVTGGPVLDAIWRRLLDRAGPVPRGPTTLEPDLHLLADGRRVESEPGPAGVYLFRFQHRPAEIRLVSRVGVPAELGLARDPRPLGVAVREIKLWRGPDLRRMEASDALLDDGFHLFEADNAFRWTDGNAGLPGTLLTGVNSAFDVEVHVVSTTHYPKPGDTARPIAA